MKLTTTELVYINEAGKALKQKDFMIIDNYLIGLDNINNILSYIKLDTEFVSNIINGMIINQRALSAFIKSISIESDFEYDRFNTVLRSISGGELQIKFDMSLAMLACEKFKYASCLENSFQSAEIEAQDIMQKLQSMNKSDGGAGINYNGHYMVVFPSVLPSNKSDKMYIRFIDYPESNIFTAVFRVQKKKFCIMTYISYMNI